MKHRKLFIALMVLFSVIVALATFIVIWLWGDEYPDFEDFSASVEIPGLKDGFVPQGIANYNNDEYFFISGHMKKGPSRIYVTGKNGYVGFVTLKDTDGSDFYGHCGGIATNGAVIWVSSGSSEASGGRVYVMKASSGYTYAAKEIIERAALPDGENCITFTSSFLANCNASFCYYYDAPNSSADKLYVGEFYRSGKYETRADHHVTNENTGANNTAFVYEYSVNNQTEYGLSTITAAQTVPKIDRIYSITDEIQGFARTEKGVVLSASWGLKNSTLYYHDWDKVQATANRKSFKLLTGNNFTYEGLTTVNGMPYTDKDLYVYFIDSGSLLREYSIPAMSEGLCSSNGRVFVLFESACYKYKAFTRMRTDEVYSFIPRIK